MDSEKLTDERAIEVLQGFAAGERFKALDADDRGAFAAGAAAIAAQEELLDALTKLVTDDPSEEWIDYDNLIFKYRNAVDLLVHFGRVLKDGDSYRWNARPTESP